MVATHIKKTKHSMLCVTGVYLRDITNTNFVILHLNVSHLSDCFSCFFSLPDSDCVSIEFKSDPAYGNTL